MFLGYSQDKVNKPSNNKLRSHSTVVLQTSGLKMRRCFFLCVSHTECNKSSSTFNCSTQGLESYIPSSRAPQGQLLIKMFADHFFPPAPLYSADKRRRPSDREPAPQEAWEQCSNTVIDQIVQYMHRYCHGSQIHMNNAGSESNQPQKPTPKPL